MTLGDIKNIDHPQIGKKYEINQVIGKLESNSGIMTIYSPLSIWINWLNSDLFQDSTKINCNFDSAWIAEFSIEDDSEVK